ncbi:MAG TPA: GNAT family N-acetyltransferase [Rhodocyclaceae bacterium]|nr:GNAT family N-acetyltransferase [Rhodocyclaceae bacterium]
MMLDPAAARQAAGDDAAGTCSSGDDGVSPLVVLGNRLEAGNWSIRSWRRYLADIEAHSGSLSPAERVHWLAAMSRTWARYGWAFNEEALVRLFNVSAAWCAWPLVSTIGQALARRRPLHMAELLRLADAYRHCADSDQAIELLVASLLPQPEAAPLAAAHQELIAWHAARERYGWVDGSDWGDEELLLEPLGHHHLQDFAWQYFDPAIAELCCLPAFESDDQWHAWLDGTYRNGDQWVGAVIHRKWGFIGSVSLIMHGGIGFFYYWFGPDFQGRGYGPRAVRLLLATAAERHGLHTCYAKVYDYNYPSRRALEKLGFEDIQVSAAAPDNNELFYRRGSPAQRAQIAEEIHWLMASMQSHTRPAILLMPSSDRVGSGGN